MKSLYDIFKSGGIVESSLGNWKFLIFICILLCIMIGSSHTLDYKVRYLTVLNKELRGLKLLMVDYKSQYVEKTRFSNMMRQLKGRGFVFSSVPPELISIKEQ